MLIRIVFVLLNVVIAQGCSDRKAEEEEARNRLSNGCASAPWLLNGAALSRACLDIELNLNPGITSEGGWVSATECTESTSGFVCVIDDFGRLKITTTGDRLATSFTAYRTGVVHGHGFRGTLKHPGALAWLSNGFQSWSQSGILSIPQGVTDDERDYALGERGDFEVLRSGYELSWWHTFVSSQQSTIVLGALTAKAFKSWVSLSGSGPAYEILVMSGGVGETIEVKTDETIEGENWFIGMSPVRDFILQSYGQALPTREESELEPEAGWNSWYQLWSTVDADAVRDNAPLARAILKDRLPQKAPKLRIVIDDGWQKAWGDWRPNDKFSQNMKPLVEELKAENFEVGIWLAPLLVEHDHPLVEKHPDWFLPTAEFLHLENGLMRVIDVTNPDAAAHLKSIIQTAVGWGFDLLKIDFLFAGTYEDERAQSSTGLQAYRRSLEIIREAAGPKTGLLLVGAPPIAGFDIADAWRIGPDVATTAFDVSWFFVANVGRTLSARWPYCFAILCDGDPPLLRTLEKEQFKVGAWAAAMAGGALFLSDDLRKLDRSRFDWLTDDMVETALARKPSIPLDLPSTIPDSLSSALSDQRANKGTHAVPIRWRLPSQREILINFSDEAVIVEGQNIPRRTSRLLSE